MSHPISHASTGTTNSYCSSLRDWIFVSIRLDPLEAEKVSLSRTSRVYRRCCFHFACEHSSQIQQKSLNLFSVILKRGSAFLGLTFAMKTTHISILTLLTLTSVSAYEAGVALSASENAGGSERLRRPGTRNQRSLKKLKHVLPEVPGTQVEESSEGFSKLEDEPDVEEAETIEDEVPMTTRVLNLTAFTDLRGGQDHLDSKSVESNVKKASAGYQMMGKGSNGMGQNGKMTEGQGAAKGKKHSHSGKGKGAHAGKGKGAAKGKSKSKKASTSGKKKGKATGKTKKNGKKEMETISPSTFFPTTDFPVDSEAPSSAPLETSSPVANMVGSQFHITLDLEDVESGLRGAFQKAALRWQEIVIGDLEEYELDDETRQESYCSRLPQDSIDDLFVCASTGKFTYLIPEVASQSRLKTQCFLTSRNN